MRDIWSYVDTQPAPPSSAAGEQMRGRVLRVKDGYNPNSSSIGSAIPVYLGFAVTSGALTVMLLNLRSTVGDLLRKGKEPPPPPAEEDEPAEAAASAAEEDGDAEVEGSA